MMFCIVFYALYAISVLICTFAVFRLNPALKNWIDRFSDLATASLMDLAKSSDKEALNAFALFLLVAGLTAFGLLVAFDSFLGDRARSVLSVAIAIFIYAYGSIGAWSNNREKITQQFIDETWRDSGRYTKYYLAISLFLFLVIVGICALAGELGFTVLGPMLIFIIAGLAALVGSVVLANSVAILLVFAPALAAIAVLWVAILLARGALAIGKNGFVNAIAAYSILGTLYLALLSLPGLRLFFNVPAICQ